MIAGISINLILFLSPALSSEYIGTVWMFALFYFVFSLRLLLLFHFESLLRIRQSGIEYSAGYTLP